MTAAMLVLEPIFEADLPPEQYAYRPGRALQRSAHTDLRRPTSAFDESGSHCPFVLTSAKDRFCCKGFCSSEHARLIQDQAPKSNVDSKSIRPI